jgi:hypothetical protein
VYTNKKTTVSSKTKLIDQSKGSIVTNGSAFGGFDWPKKSNVFFMATCVGIFGDTTVYQKQWNKSSICLDLFAS